MILVIVFLVLATTLALAVGYAMRNHRVYKYRLHILDEIAKVIDINPYDFDWRIRVYQSVGYMEMLLKIWKPLDSFYPDKSFLDLNIVRGRAPWEKAS